MHFKLTVLLVFFIYCATPAKLKQAQTNHFPATTEKITTLPPKENFYIFLMAGQSNMAGRGFVQPGDTTVNARVVTLNKNNEWVYAKEPLHYYEPTRTGLDCGLSFGKKLSNKYANKITIGLVPCAIGGSSIEQWLGDSTYRNVTLYSNFLQKAKTAAQQGVIKGMLWHQGESNAGVKSHIGYKEKLDRFFAKVRKDLQQPSMPIYLGPLGSYLTKASFPFTEAVNHDIRELSQTGSNIFIIKTSNFSHLADTIHFDSKSQRLMGKRFAKKVYKTRNL